MLDTIAERLQKEIKARKKDIKNTKTQDLEKQVSIIKGLIKDVNEELKPIKEAQTILKGYVAEVEAILHKGQISIFEV